MNDPTRDINRDAWNYYAEQGDRWSTAVSSEEIAETKKGNWELYLIESRPVPKAWLGDIKAKQILCLASGGGQQAPRLAAARCGRDIF